MLKYEFKKLFGKRKGIVLLALFIGFLAFCAVVISRIVPEMRAGYFSEEELFSRYGEVFGGFLTYVQMIVVAVTASLFPMEFTNNMSEIAMSSKYGKNKLVSTKIIMALLLGNGITISYIIVFLIGYFSIFGFDFNIPIVAGWELDYLVDPDVRTQGDCLIREIFGTWLIGNFLLLLSLLVSQKTKKAFSTSVIVIVSGLALTFMPGDNPVMDLSPFCFSYRPSTYKELFMIGETSVTALDIGYVVYIILILLLLIRIKSASKVK